MGLHRPRQRPSFGRGGARRHRPPAGRPRQPDPPQPDPRLRHPRHTACRRPGLPGSAVQLRGQRHRAPEPGHDHRRRLRTAGCRNAGERANPPGSCQTLKMRGRWLNPTQPQTLQGAVLLLYLNSALSLLFSLGYLGPYGLLIVAGGVGGGWGIANERKWGYGLGLVVALAPFLISLAFFHTILPGGNILAAAFPIVLVVLLLHPQSREYQRIWFK